MVEVVLGGNNWYVVVCLLKEGGTGKDGMACVVSWALSNFQIEFHCLLNSSHSFLRLHYTKTSTFQEQEGGGETGEGEVVAEGASQ